MKRNTKLIISTFGLVVESVPTKHGSRVRFPEGAIFLLLIKKLFGKENIKSNKNYFFN